MLASVALPARMSKRLDGQDGPKESHNQGGDQGDCKHPVQPLWRGGQPERQPIAPPTQICIQILSCCEVFNLKFDFNFEIGLSFKNWFVSLKIGWFLLGRLPA